MPSEPPRTGLGSLVSRPSNFCIDLIRPMGAYNTTLTNKNKGFKLTANDKISESDKEPELPEYVQTATTYPEGTTLAGKELPSFNKDRKAF